MLFCLYIFHVKKLLKGRGMYDEDLIKYMLLNDELNVLATKPDAQPDDVEKLYDEIDIQERKLWNKASRGLLCSQYLTGNYPYPQHIYYCNKCKEHVCVHCKTHHEGHYCEDMGYPDEYFCKCSKCTKIGIDKVKQYSKSCAYIHPT